MCKFKSIIAALAISTATTAAYADGHGSGWTLDPALSNVSFGSIKNDSVGESHSFGDVSGSVSADGAVSISLGLATVETLIDIRDERMVDHVFRNVAVATISAKLDMTELVKLPVGEATVIETAGTLSLLGTDNELDATFFIMRVSEDQVLVTTDSILMLSMEDAGLNAGIDMLQNLASLDSITRVSPVTMRLVFETAS